MKFANHLAAAAIGVALAAAPVAVQANSDKENTDAALAAAVILGLGALAHQSQHHQNGSHTTDAQYEAAYERGYSDGLHNFDIEVSNVPAAYGEGYAAGQKERENRGKHVNTANSGHHKATKRQMKGCIGEASAYWGINPRDISAVKSIANDSQASSGNFLVEVAAGHKHGFCDMDANGNISGDFVEGKL